MKKTISINISGILFHIEEDGYDTLRKYLDGINRHFSSYKDNHEIISDIENRIAEIFLSNLKNNKQVITAENVDKLIEKMGTIADFASVEEEVAEQQMEEENLEKDQDFYKYVTPPDAEKKGYKKLMRLENRKILGGVCAGIAHYFTIDPLWTRLIAILLLFSGNLRFNFGFLDIWPFDDFRLNLSFGLFAAVAYIVLWIILPVSYEIEEDKNIKKLYRNPDDKVIGGVASGLAAYFGVEVIYTRLALVLLILAGGSGFLIYLILWIITPVASSITERIRMKGGEITLDNIDSTIKENINPIPKAPESRTRQILMTPFRVIGQIIEAIGSALGPLGRFFLNVIRVIFGLLVFFLGLGLTITPIFSAAIYLGIFSNDDYRVLMDNFPIELFSNLVPLWLVIGASFLLIIPGIIIILLGLSVLMQKNLIGARFGFVALGLWLLCVGICAFQIPLIIAQFKEENWHKIEQTVPVSDGIMILRLNPIGEESTFNNVNLKIEGTSDSTVTLREEFFARGKTKAEAMNNAKMISYNYDVLDSVVTFNEGYDITNLDTFRDQKLNLFLEVPYDKPFIMERSLLEILRNTIYRNGYQSTDLSQNTIWSFNQQGLVCLTCKEEVAPDDDEESEGVNFEVEEPETGEYDRAQLDSISRAKFNQSQAPVDSTVLD
ncbi:Phage shock protein PspC (stress-responsive transcriptional regulator) [Algoriphagus locisalis]|uniref:Phage shock protein PspC (Stress-responsive transcriptional regulator) n=1 Tax=Algoriphagus locisalis TaxID=305507 RepID=A0A1I7BSB3_9BACT|nr:PspC domain-containing protein [Algoriphagus locisalis]SFT90079.1 Phage shock protein PspC (stress-responsive transcriptional regulator) [Algoriphagus locisalis]